MYEPLEASLLEAGIGAQVAHMGPFGRRELRSFVEKLAGGPSVELVERVLAIIRTQRLPRNPFVITALVTVILKNIELADVNESSLLDAYVSFLLGQGETYDRLGLDMDYRRREHLLSVFASHLAEGTRTALPRLAVEEFIAKYFRDRGWAERLSPGKVADDLIGRRILHENKEGSVGFRHPAFRELFAGKAMIDDPVFASSLTADPLANAGAIRHAAGLRRSDAVLLRTVAHETRAIIDAAALGVDVKMFDLIKDRPGWSKDDPDTESLRRRLEIPPPEEPAEEELDEQIDAYHDRLDFDEVADTERHPVDTAWETAGLLANVLRNSELIDDLELKTQVLKTVIGDWSLFIVMAAVREDQEGYIRERLAGIAPRSSGEEVVAVEVMARLVDLLLVFISVVAVQSALGTVHLEGTVVRALEDEEFMSSTAHALLTTMLYAAIGAPDWPERLAVLYHRQREHPVVAEIARTYALATYQYAGLSDAELPKIEQFLADVYAKEPVAVPGYARALARNQERSKVLDQLRKSRVRDGPKEVASRSLDDVLDTSDEDEDDDDGAETTEPAG